jgi:putative hydrolase of the HAD superfamily
MNRYSTVFLDLDDTLYPSSNGIWDAIGERINLFMMERLAIEPDRVRVLRDSYFHNYGTTLHGLMANHDADPDEYLDFVHDVPLEDMLLPNPLLKSMLGKLPQRRIVFTNASYGHVVRVLHRLGIEQEIDAIVDLLAMNMRHKPQPQSYQLALAAAEETDASACIMVDDRIDNLLPAAALGMTTVWMGIDTGEKSADHRIEVITDLIEAVPDLLVD